VGCQTGTGSWRRCSQFGQLDPLGLNPQEWVWGCQTVVSEVGISIVVPYGKSEAYCLEITLGRCCDIDDWDLECAFVGGHATSWGWSRGSDGFAYALGHWACHGGANEGEKSDCALHLVWYVQFIFARLQRGYSGTMVKWLVMSERPVL